jgi:hypothetical protein
MATWKQLADKNPSLNSSYSSKKHQRYTPKKNRNNEHNSWRFHNHTLDRLSQDSEPSEDHDKPKDHSFIDKPQGMPLPRVIKASPREGRTQRDSLHEPKNSIIDSSFIVNIQNE